MLCVFLLFNLIGRDPIESKESKIEIILSDKDVKYKWGAWVESTKDDVTRLEIMTPPDVYVGKWTLKLDVVKRADTLQYVFRYDRNLHMFILFNPWCQSKFCLRVSEIKNNIIFINIILFQYI